jgi:hypothetical protein
MDETRLRWVHYNHGEPGRRPKPPIATGRTQAREQWEGARRGRVVPAGDLVKAALEARTKLSTLQRRLLAMLEEQAGGELLDHVTTVEVSRGTLRVETAESAVLYDLRLRWEQRILGLVDAHLPELGIHTVRFALAKGQSGSRPGRR